MAATQIRERCSQPVHPAPATELPCRSYAGLEACCQEAGVMPVTFTQCRCGAELGAKHRHQTDCLRASETLVFREGDFNCPRLPQTEESRFVCVCPLRPHTHTLRAPSDRMQQPYGSGLQAEHQLNSPTPSPGGGVVMELAPAPTVPTLCPPTVSGRHIFWAPGRVDEGRRGGAERKGGECMPFNKILMSAKLVFLAL